MLGPKILSAVAGTRAPRFRLATGTHRLDTPYRRDPAMGMWLPAEMVEQYESQVRGEPGRVTTPTLRIEARAQYSNFRRIRVTTEEHIKR